MPQDDREAQASAADLAHLARRGAAAHPDVSAPAGLDDFLASRAEAALRAADQDARAADLYLAAACAVGEPSAVAKLDASLPAIVRPALGRLGLPASDDGEVLQRVRVALLAPKRGGEPGITGYAGRGSLRGYLRAVAVKIALKKLEREHKGELDDDILSLLPAHGDSPELRVLKQRCREDVRAALAAAVAGLEAKQRILLRQHYLDGLTIDALGRLHGVHRATAARWLEAARAEVLRGVRRHLRGTLGLRDAELDSLLGLVQSQLDLSLSQLLPRHG